MKTHNPKQAIATPALLWFCTTCIFTVRNFLPQTCAIPSMGNTLPSHMEFIKIHSLVWCFCTVGMGAKPVFQKR